MINTKKPKVYEFGRRLKALRTQQGMKVAELADYCGVSAAAIYLYEEEKCYPNLTVATYIATALNVSLDWLVGRE